MPARTFAASSWVRCHLVCLSACSAASCSSVKACDNFFLWFLVSAADVDCFRTCLGDGLWYHEAGWHHPVRIVLQVCAFQMWLVVPESHESVFFNNAQMKVLKPLSAKLHNNNKWKIILHNCIFTIALLTTSFPVSLALPAVARILSPLYDSAGKDGGRTSTFGEAAWWN